MIGSTPVAANQVIIRLKSNTVSSLNRVLQSVNGASGRPIGSNLGLHVIHTNSYTAAALLSVLSRHPDVFYAEPNRIVHHTGTPNDPSFSSQWSMKNTVTPGADISATSAWNVTTGSSSNVIGIVDTGVDYTHPDLAANIWSAPSAFSVNISGTPLSCPTGTHGYNAITKTCNPFDDNNHGTHVSGTVGAVGNNGIGVAGVNWTTRIMALKFLDASGSGSIADAVDAELTLLHVSEAINRSP